MKKMRIRIDKNGKTTISVEGAAGADCLEFTRAIEQALGYVEQRVLTEDCEQDSLTVQQEVTQTL